MTKAQSHYFLWEITELLAGIYCAGNSWTGEPLYFPHRAILLRIPLATVIRLAKNPFLPARPPLHFPTAQMAANNDFSQPVVADDLNSTGRSGDIFPRPSLDVYKGSPFLIRAIFRFPNDKAEGRRRFLRRPSQANCYARMLEKPPYDE